MNQSQWLYSEGYEKPLGINIGLKLNFISSIFSESFEMRNLVSKLCKKMYEVLFSCKNAVKYSRKKKRLIHYRRQMNYGHWLP
jgi:hypothetical protein